MFRLSRCLRHRFHTVRHDGGERVEQVLMYFSFIISSSPTAISDEEGVPTQYSADVLTSSALGVIERALYDSRPSETYCLSVPNSKFQMKLPCRSSLKISASRTDSKPIQSV